MAINKHQYTWKPMTEGFSLEDAVMDSMAEKYTAALAQSLNNTRNTLLRELLDDAPLFGKSHEIEVNFDGKE